MAKSFDDDDDFYKFKPGTIDVDDLFDSSDEPFEENDVEVGTVNGSESTEDYSDYTFDYDDKPVKVENEEDDSDDIFDFDEETANDEETMNAEETIIDEDKQIDSSEKYEIDKESSVEDIINKLTEEMLQHAEKMEFEEAAKLRDQIKELESSL